jgi:hypothetical protein
MVWATCVKGIPRLMSSPATHTFCGSGGPNMNPVLDSDSGYRGDTQTVARGNLAPWYLARLYKGHDFSVALHSVRDVASALRGSTDC